MDFVVKKPAKKKTESNLPPGFIAMINNTWVRSFFDKDLRKNWISENIVRIKGERIVGYKLESKSGESPYF